MVLRFQVMGVEMREATGNEVDEEAKAISKN